jgi:YVTN family beta-propeller protein
MSSDVRDREVREFLLRMANEAPASASAPRAALRRAHHRLALTGFIGLMVVGLVVFGAVSGIRAIEAAPTQRPADQGGSPTTITVGAQPTALTVGEGAVWVANSGDGTVSRIDPATDQVVATIEVGGQDSNFDITSGDGAVWVTTAGDLVQRIDPETNEVVATVDVPAPIHPATGFGAVWVSDYDAGSVTRIDSAANDVAAMIPVPGSDPHGIAILGDSIWATIDDTGDVVRIDPVTNQATAAWRTGSFGDLVGGFDSLWGPGPGGAILRIDPTTGSSVSIDVGSGKHYEPELTVGDDAVWVIAPGPVGSRLERIDPTTNTVVGALELGGAYLVEVGFGSVWVLDASDGSVLRLDPGDVPPPTDQPAPPEPSPGASSGQSGASGPIVPGSDSETLPEGGSLDLDSDATSAADLTLIDGSLEPAGGSWLASVTDEVGVLGDRVGDYRHMGPLDLRTYRFSQEPLGSDQLEVGDVIAVFTNQGRYAKIEVLSRTNAALELRWAAYPHGGSQPCWFSGNASGGGVDPSGVPILAQGEITLCGTFVVDLDTGTTQDGLAPDIQWEQIDGNRARVTIEGYGGRGLANLGATAFDAVTIDQLRGLDYSVSTIPGNVVGSNQLVDGDVFAVSTSDGHYAKIQILHYGYDLQIRFVTYVG